MLMLRAIAVFLGCIIILWLKEIERRQQAGWRKYEAGGRAFECSDW